jgi:AcrR family transcriptional regulator
MALSTRQLAAMEKVFIEEGFEAITMIAIAQACGFTRRALYHHYSGKDEAFRDATRFGNARGFEAARTAMERAFAANESAIGVVHALLNTRFGDTRRLVSRSPHAQELSDTVSRLCGDIVDALAAKLHAELAVVLERLQAIGKMKLRQDVTFAQLAYLLAASVRGINQTRPLLKEHDFSPRYREIITAIMRGCAKLTPE